MQPKNRFEPWLFSLPALLVYIFTVLIPIVWSLTYSFYDYNGIDEKVFIGFGNYIRMFTDDIFKISVINNIFFMVVGSIFQLAFGMLMAIILSNISKGSNVLRVIFFIPCIISSMAISQIFSKLLSIQPQGVVNYIFESLGMQQVSFLTEPTLTLLLVTLIDGYKYSGLYMVIFYSAFMAIDSGVLEAAYIDGCTWFQSHRYIKLPLIKSVFFIALALVVNGTLKGFDVSYILTRGGPGTSSELVATYMYKTAFSSVDFGYGSALSVFLVIESLIAVSFVQFIANKNKA